MDKLRLARRYGVQSRKVSSRVPFDSGGYASREPRLSLTRAELMSIVEDAISRLDGNPDEFLVD